MTVQIINAVSMSFMSGKQNMVSSGSENSFDTFLVDKAPETSTKCAVNPKVQDAWKQTEKSEETIRVESDKTVMEADTVDATEDGERSVEDVTSNDSLNENLPENVLAEILSVLTQIVSVLQENLQLDSQKMITVAEELQFDLQDFFDSDRIKELFLKVNDIEVSALLTDENLYSALEQLQDMLSDVLENSDLSLVLQQEGMNPETFELSLFQNEMSAYIMEKSNFSIDADEFSENDVVIDFDSLQLEKNEADLKVSVKTDVTELSEVVNTDTGSDIGSDSDGNSFESEHSFEQASLFLQKLVSSAKADTEIAINSNNAVDLYDIATQIIEQVKLHIRPDNTRMEIQLNPEHLGKVELEITSKNGELSARLNVQNDHVKETIESQMQVLRETLEVQGIKVETIEVTVAEFGFRFQDEQGNAEQFQQRRQRTRFVDEEDTVLDEESYSDIANVMKEMNGNSVDYVA